jgi:hypothetical protein
VPFKDKFSIGWLMRMGEKVAVAFANRADLEVHEEMRSLHFTIKVAVHKLLAAPELAVRGLKRVVGEALRFEVRIGAEPVPAQKLDDFGQLFRTIGLPPVSKDYQDDAAFAAMRLAGPNPVMLTRLAARDPRLPITDADFKIGAPNDSFDAALAEGRLYLVDYAVLNGAECGDYPHGRKYIEARRPHASAGYAALHFQLAAPPRPRPLVRPGAVPPRALGERRSRTRSVRQRLAPLRRQGIRADSHEAGARHVPHEMPRVARCGEAGRNGLLLRRAAPEKPVGPLRASLIRADNPVNLLSIQTNSISTGDGMMPARWPSSRSLRIAARPRSP